MNPKATVLLACAPAAALVAGLVLAFAPVYSSGESLIEVNGSWTLLLLAALVAVTAVPLRLSQTWQPAAATGVGVAILAFSFISVIGIWFLPAAGMLLVASWLTPSDSKRERRSVS